MLTKIGKQYSSTPMPTTSGNKVYVVVAAAAAAVNIAVITVIIIMILYSLYKKCTNS